MDLVSIFLLAFGLSMDSFAVALSGGLTARKTKFILACKLAGLFGSFHFGMIILGYYLGREFQEIIANFDHWVAFGLLTFVGTRMIYESFKEGHFSKKMVSWSVLLILSIATSIDALALGFSFPLIGVEAYQPAIIIGLMTAFFSFLGVYIGESVGKMFGKRIGIFGGVILIIIGLKILAEHLFS